MLAGAELGILFWGMRDRKKMAVNYEGPGAASSNKKNWDIFYKNNTKVANIFNFLF